MSANEGTGNSEIGGASNSAPQTPISGVFFSEIGLSVKKVRGDKYVLKSKYGLWEDRDLNGIVVVVEAMFGKKYGVELRKALGE